MRPRTSELRHERGRHDDPHRRGSGSVHARADHSGGGAVGGRLYPASLPSSGIRAARQLQTVQRGRQWPQRFRLHDEGGRRPGGRGRHARLARLPPDARANAVRRGQSLLSRLRKERRLPVAGARLRQRDDDAAFRRVLPAPPGRRLAPGRAARLQSLHPMRALRAREPRRRRQIRLRARRAGHGFAHHRQLAERQARRHELLGRRQGRARVSGRRYSHQARRICDADRRTPLRPRADQRGSDALRGGEPK